MNANLADSLLRAAREYVHIHGFSVVSMGKEKKPTREWKSLQRRQPTDGELQSMFCRKNSVGVAIIGGFGDVAGRDFDAPGSYTGWTQEQPELAASIPTVMSPGGADRAHVHFRWPNTPTKAFADGELKGERSLLIMPPSLHPNGGTYAWLIPPGNDGFPLVDPAKIGLFPAGKRTTGNDGEDGNDGNDGNDGMQLVLSSGFDPDALVSPFLPTASGQNDKQIMRLARALRAIEVRIGREVTFREFSLVFAQWWDKNPHQPSEGRDYGLDKFQRAYNTCRSPLGVKHEELAKTRIKGRPLPKIALRYADETTRRAVALLREMQAIAGEGRSWPLACNQLGAVLGLSDRGAWGILERLRSRPDPIIRRVTLGKRIPGTLPSTWLYLQPLDEGDTANA